MQAFWMVLAAFFFASMAVCVKIASAWFTSAELVFYRGVLGMLIMWALASRQGLTLATRYPLQHAARSLVGVAALGAWFYAISSGLPFATAFTLNYTSSIWLAAGLVVAAWLGLGAGGGLRGRQVLMALTVLAGFAGVVMILRPTIEQDQIVAGLWGLLSGMLSAWAYLLVRQVGRLGEPESRTVFYFAAASAAAGGLGMLITGLSPWDWRNALWLLPLSILASLGQLCMTRAYSRGATLLVANLQYSGVVFAALYSLLLFAEYLPPIGWVGMALILASGVAATVLRAKANPAPVPVEKS